MKLILFLTIVAAAFSLTAPPAFAAEQRQPAASATPAAEPLGENEPIPFMRSEQAKATAEEPSSVGLLLKTIASMAFIVGLIFVGAWAARKLGYGNKSFGPDDAAQVSVLTSVSLGGGRTVSAIRFGGRVLLVGSTPQSFTLLAEEESDAAAAEPIVPRSVGELLADDKPTFVDKLKQAESRIGNFLRGGNAS